MKLMISYDFLLVFETSYKCTYSIDELLAEEVRQDLGNVVDDGRYAEERRRAVEIL